MNTTSARVAISVRSLLLGGVAAASFALPGIASAQTAEPPAEQATEEFSDGNEIIVTATKREQTLQDVPVAVSVTTAETIERAQIRDIKDLSSVVPSLRVSQLQSSANTNFFIRGFGNGANNAGIEPSVGLFVDGVYRSRSASTVTDLPDIKRVEVLRGPQSTLFGKNASAGVISIVTAEPQFQFGGNVEASYGNYDAIVLKGVVTGPISDSLAFSVAGGLNKRDGTVRDLAAGGRTNERNRWFARGQLLFEGDSGLKVRLIGDYAKTDENCCAVVNLIPSPSTAAITSPFVGGQVTAPGQRFDGVVYNNFASTNDIENWGLSGQVDYELGSLKLTSITAYRKTQAVTNQDSDFTSGELLRENSADLRIKTFTQELRVASDFDGPLNFLAGAFYYNEKIAQDGRVLMGNDFRGYADALIRGQSGGAFTLAQVEQVLGAAQGNPALYVNRFFQDGRGLTESYRLKDESISLFGQVDFEITDGLVLTAGLNYTRDKKRFSTGTTSDEVFSAVPLAPLIPPVTNVLIAQAVGGLIGAPGGFATPAQILAFATNPATAAIYSGVIQPRSAAGANQLLSLTALQVFPPFLNVPNAVESGRLKDSDLSYTARLAYDATDTINVYVSYATGYKPGSVNLSRDSRPFPGDRAAIIANPTTNLPNLAFTSRYADPEDSTVYEAGIKGNWGIVSANFAVFKQSIKNFQSNIFSGTGFFLTNAGKQSTFGLEFEGTAKPVPELTLGLSMTYLDPKYDSFPASPFGDLTGFTPAGVPPISATFSAQWDQPIGSGGDHLILRGDFHYESKYVPVEGLPGFLERDPTAPAGTVRYTPASIANAIDLVRQFGHEVNDLNGSLTYAMANGLEVSVWGRNLLNDRYIIQVFDSPAQQRSVSGYPNQPRTYGVSVRFKW